MPHYLVVDSETSHLFDYSKPADAPGQPRLAQLGLIHVNSSFEIEAEHEFLIKPEGWEMSAEATEKTGLTTEFLKANGMPIAEALALYKAGIAARRVVAGFNVQFDLKMMRAEMRRAGMEDDYLQTRNLCLMWATRAIVAALDAKGKVKIPKLEEACAFFGIAQPKKHGALPDAHSAYQLMLKLVERGALPEPKSPYDRAPKKAKAPKKRTVGLPGDELDDADQDIPDFLGGAAADSRRRRLQSPDGGIEPSTRSSAAGSCGITPEKIKMSKPTKTSLQRDLRAARILLDEQSTKINSLTIISGRRIQQDV